MLINTDYHLAITEQLNETAASNIRSQQWDDSSTTEIERTVQSPCTTPTDEFTGKDVVATKIVDYQTHLRRLSIYQHIDVLEILENHWTTVQYRTPIIFSRYCIAAYFACNMHQYSHRNYYYFSNSSSRTTGRLFFRYQSVSTAVVDGRTASVFTSFGPSSHCLTQKQQRQWPDHHRSSVRIFLRPRPLLIMVHIVIVYRYNLYIRGWHELERIYTLPYVLKTSQTNCGTSTSK